MLVHLLCKKQIKLYLEFVKFFLCMLYFKKNVYQKCKQYIHLPNFENIHNLLIESVLPIHMFCTHQFSSVQFSSVQSCLTLCGPKDCSTPGFPVHHQLIPRAYSNSCPLSRWCHPNISSSVIPFSSCFQSLPASGTFPMSQLFASGGQSWEFQLQHQSLQWIFRTGFL